MITLPDLIAAINEQPDLSARASDYLYACARQADKGNAVNANTLLVEAVNLLRDNIGIRDDLLISQVAFEFVRLGQMNRAGNAVNFISDETIKNEALSRMARERAKTDAQDAVAIADAITNVTLKDDALGHIAANVAERGELVTARAIVATISDTFYAGQLDRHIIREASKGL